MSSHLRFGNDCIGKYVIKIQSTIFWGFKLILWNLMLSLIIRFASAELNQWGHYWEAKEIFNFTVGSKEDLAALFYGSQVRLYVSTKPYPSSHVLKGRCPSSEKLASLKLRKPSVPLSPLHLSSFDTTPLVHEATQKKPLSEPQEGSHWE